MENLKNYRQKGVIGIVLILLLFLGIAVFFIARFKYDSSPELARPTHDNIDEISQVDDVSSELIEIPFYEMTIPYLRQRDFNSELNSFKKVYERESFTAYTTSYDSEGFKVNGLLTLPKGEMPADGWPAVIFVHGYIPPAQYRTLEKYEDYVNYLAGRGLVVFKIDLRGHDRSEGVAHGAYYSADYVIDTLNAHSALKNFDLVNSERIGLWGHSMAGNVVFRSFVASDISKVVIWAGAVYSYEDFQTYRISDNSYQPPPQETERRRRREVLFNTHGEFDPDDDFWKQVVPTNYLEDKSGYVQIHHATDDNVVDIRYSRNLIQILEETDVTSTLFEYPSGGHNISGSYFTQAMQRTADLLLN